MDELPLLGAKAARLREKRAFLGNLFSSRQSSALPAQEPADPAGAMQLPGPRNQTMRSRLRSWVSNALMRPVGSLLSNFHRTYADRSTQRPVE